MKTKIIFLTAILFATLASASYSPRSIICDPTVNTQCAAVSAGGVISVDGSSVTQPVSGTFWQATQPISAASLPLPTGAATQTTLASILTALGSPLQAGGSVSVSGSVAVTGAFWQATQPVSASSLPLPTGASTETTLSSINTKTPSLGQATSASSSPVVIASDQASIPVNRPDLSISGQSAQTATINNIIPSTASSSATDATGYRSATVQVVSTGTAGTFIFEGSNDNTNFQTIPVYSQLILTGTPIVAAITATNSSLIYTFPVSVRYIRLRIATTITGGSIQAFTRLTQDSWTPAVFQVAQATTGNLLTTATIASGTVTTVSTVSAVTAANLGAPVIVADIASAALSSTTTSATFTVSSGASYSVTIPVTVVSGTTPTLDVGVEESDDSGTNWVRIYDFPRITATGYYRSPVFPATGNRIRYVQTVSGTTPSFTRAVNRLTSSITSNSPFRQIIDRTISLTTLNSTTPSLTTASAKNAHVVVNIGTTTIAPILQIEGSDDAGSTWYSVGTPLTSVASSTVQLTVNNVTSQLLRARVSTAGTSTVAGYVLLRAF